MMSVTLTMDLKPEIEAGLLARARERGVSLDSYVQELLEQLASAPIPQTLSADVWDQAFDEWIESSPAVPHLPDEALRRESIYRRD